MTTNAAPPAKHDDMEMTPTQTLGWFESYLDGRWYTFDPRNNMPRIGRVLIAQGCDATDVPITHTFDPNTLVSFKVWTEEVSWTHTSYMAAIRATHRPMPMILCSQRISNHQTSTQHPGPRWSFR